MRCAPKPASPRRSAPPIPDWAGDAIAELTRTETFALTAIAYLQPVTRGEISKLAGREISRDIIAALKRHGLIDGAIRAPQPGAPFAYVTTRKFLEAFGFASLRDLPDLERLKAEGLLNGGRGRMISIARLGLVMLRTTATCFRATRSWMRRRRSECPTGSSLISSFCGNRRTEFTGRSRGRSLSCLAP